MHFSEHWRNKIHREIENTHRSVYGCTDFAAYTLLFGANSWVCILDLQLHQSE